MRRWPVVRSGGVDALLVGDSLGMSLGHDTTRRYARGDDPSHERGQPRTGRSSWRTCRSDYAGHHQRSGPQRRPAAAGGRRGGSQARRRPAHARCRPPPGRRRHSDGHLGVLPQSVHQMAATKRRTQPQDSDAIIAEPKPRGSRPPSCSNRSAELARTVTARVGIQPSASGPDRLRRQIS